MILEETGNMRKKRMLSLLLALLLLLVCFASCGKTGDADGPARMEPDGESGTEPDDARPSHQVPELDFNGATFGVLHSGFLPEYFVEELTGDTLNDAVFKRMTDTESYLNVTFFDDAREDDIKAIQPLLSKLVMAGDDVYSMVISHCIAGVSALVTENCLMPYEKLPYVDLDAEWWNQRATEELRLGEYTFYGVSDFEIPNPYGVFFNRDIVTDYNLPDPYEMVEEGTWTLDRFVDMALKATKDLDGDGQIREGDQCGITAEELSRYTSIMTASGQYLTERNEDGRLVIIANTERMQSIIEKLYRAVSRKGTIWYDQESGKNVFEEGHILFSLDAISNGNQYRGMDVDLGLVPYPKYDEEQKEYLSLDFGCLVGVPSSVTDRQMVGAVIEYMAWDSANTVRPAYFDVYLDGKLARDPDMRRMLQLLFDTITYEAGGNYFGFTNGFRQLFYTMGSMVVSAGDTAFASWYKQNERPATYALKDFYKSLDKVETLWDNAK